MCGWVATLPDGVMIWEELKEEMCGDEVAVKDEMWSDGNEKRGGSMSMLCGLLNGMGLDVFGMTWAMRWLGVSGMTWL